MGLSTEVSFTLVVDLLSLSCHLAGGRTYQGRESGAGLDSVAVNDLNVRGSPDDTVDTQFGCWVNGWTKAGKKEHVRRVIKYFSSAPPTFGLTVKIA